MKFFLIDIAVGFRLFINHRQSQRDIFLVSSVHTSVHTLSVWNHISVTIGQS